MSNLDQENKDQGLNPSGTNSRMEEDSSAMTVEFLRARLLSERSVSRSARQRADELAKRVAELEEQLRIVHVQRTKAEKATADVLAILESNGITEASEAYYSSSDHETPSESNAGDKSLREEESSVDSKVRKNDSEEVSGSDADFSLVRGRSLSWKGHKESPRLLEKLKDPTLRRRSSFASVGTYPKHRQGKSCRQVRRKDSRSVPEELKAIPIKASSLEKEVAIGSTTGEDGGLPQNSVEQEQNASFNGSGSNELGKVVDMEKALEHQSQLIGRYEEMEKVQREWEEKFREHNNGTPDSCDPGNRSDVTEERFEVKARTPVSADTVFEFHGAKSQAQDMSKFELPSSHIVMQPLQEQSSSNRSIQATITQSSSLQETNGNQHQGSLASTYHPTSDVSTPYQSPSLDSPIIHSAQSSSSNTANGIGHGKPSVSRNEPYALVPHQGPNQLESVLDALKQAKQSLEQKIDELPFVEDRAIAGKFMHSSLPITVPENKADMPMGCDGLFRLPNDLSVNDEKRILTGSNTQPGISSGYYPDRGLPTSATNHSAGLNLETRPSFLPDRRFLTNPIMEKGIKPRFPPDQRFLTSPVMEEGIKPSFLPDQRFLTSPVMEEGIKPSFPPDQRFLTSPIMEAGIKPSFLPNQRFLASPVVEEGSRIANPMPSFNPYSDTGLPSSRRYSNNYPTYLVNPSFPDNLTTTVPSRGVPTFARRRTVGPMAADNFSLLNGSIRPNMYR